MAATGSIPRQFIESLIQRSDIVAIINQRVGLKKAGNSYKACCPFHEEKTPSFNVNPVKQFYHCFGCGASGDALKFLMEYDGLTFVEAVEQLAAMNGMEVPREQLSPKQQEKAQERRQVFENYYELMSAVAKFYRSELRSHPQSEQAKQYLRKRGLTPEIAKEFVIGFAAEGWQNLHERLFKTPQYDQALVELGLLIAKENGKSYDRFRERIMFPIRDGRGRVIAFGGRILDQGQPKYLNSPETPLFHKSQVLYGLYEMRQSRQKFHNIIVVEGYMDVVSLAQFGIRNVVATLGTAVTVEHLQILFQQVSEIVFCFDGDSAGVKAAWKAAELAVPNMEGERSVRFLFLDEGEDPDSTVRKIGGEALIQRFDSAMTLSEFIKQGLLRKIGGQIRGPESKQQLVTLAEPYILNAHGLYQYLLVEMLAEQVNLPPWRLEKQLNIRTGYAQIDRSKKASAQSHSNPVSDVITVPLKIIKYICLNPAWVKKYPADFLQALYKLDGDFRVLALAVDFVQKNNGADQLVQRVKAFLENEGFAKQANLFVKTIVAAESEAQVSEYKELSMVLVSMKRKAESSSQDLDEEALRRVLEEARRKQKK